MFFKIVIGIFLVAAFVGILFIIAILNDKPSGSSNVTYFNDTSSYGDYRDKQKYRNGMELVNGKPREVDNSHRGRR